MNVKLLACLACSTALLVGACSGGNPPAGSGTESETPGGDTNGEAPDDDNGDSGATERRDLVTRATAAITQATNAAPGARAAARDEIQEVIDAIDAAVKAAKTASRCLPSLGDRNADRTTRCVRPLQPFADAPR